MAGYWGDALRSLEVSQDAPDFRLPKLCGIPLKLADKAKMLRVILKLTYFEHKLIIRQFFRKTLGFKKPESWYPKWCTGFIRALLDYI